MAARIFFNQKSQQKNTTNVGGNFFVHPKILEMIDLIVAIQTVNFVKIGAIFAIFRPFEVSELDLNIASLNVSDLPLIS